MHAFSVADVPLMGRSLVEASAGTGKTYAISTLFIRLLLSQQLTVRQILVVTFTEAATAELKTRVRLRLQEAVNACDAVLNGRRHSDEILNQIVAEAPHPLSAKKALVAALLEFDDASIFTIHGFCHRVLRENAFLSGASFEVDLLRDTRPLVDEVLGDFWASQLVDAPLVLIEYLRQEKLSPLHAATRSFANAVAQRPDLRVLPNQPPVPDAIAAESFLRCHREMRELFVKDEIRELLLDGRLSAKTYQRRYVVGWSDKVEDFLANSASPKIPDCLFRFGSAQLQASAKLEPPRHPAFAACDRLLEAHTALMNVLPVHKLAMSRGLLEFVQAEVSSRKRTRNALSFDDMLQKLDVALERSKRTLADVIRARYPVALLDEFQDTDPVQLSVFQQIYGKSHACVFLIGDPKQSIYSFRGADLFAYLSAAHTVSPERRYTMDTNHRSDALLVNAVNCLFSNCTRPFLFSELTFPRVRARSDARPRLELDPGLTQAPLVFRYFERAMTALRPDAKRVPRDPIPAYVAAEIGRTLKSRTTLSGRPLSPRDFAVLTRTNKEAFDCQAALAELRIPAVVLGDRSVYEYGEARELQLILSAVLEPSDSRRLRVALTTELLGYSAADLLALDADDDSFNRWVERFRGLNARWVGDGFVQMIRQLMTETDIAARLLRLPDGERRMTNLLHLVELIHTEATENHLGPSGIYAFLAEQRTRRLTESDSEQIRLESDEDAVVLTTIHKSKGLEYSIVICPYLAGAFLEHQSDTLSVRFHDDEGNTCIDLGSEDFSQNRVRMRAEVFAENLRLLYVALTRARHRCVVFWGPFSTFENSALGYLLHGRELAEATKAPPAQLMEEHIANIKEKSDLELMSALAQLCTAESGIAQSAPLSLPEGETFGLRPATLHALRAREPKPPGDAWLRTASFSELTSQATRHDVLQHDEARDLDALSELVPIPTGSPNPAAAEDSRDLTTLAEFPGGARTGNFFHKLLENTDFEQSVDAALTEKLLLEHGLEGTLQSLAAQALEEARMTPLQSNWSLKDVSAKRRINEMEFVLPVRNPTFADARPLTPLTRQALAQVFESHPSPALLPSYARHLQQLHFLPLRGFLKGFIDLVFEHEGKWYLADYKTNRLGDYYSEYDTAALLNNMSESHYYLQYHLYALALDRYLQQRVRDYDYCQHFGGVFYLYLRGMHPKHGSNFGVFYELPPLARLRALGACFGISSEGA